MRAILATTLLAGLGTLPAAAADKPAPVVVELFTSQGCSSCPPADAYLGELAQQPGIVALAFHVDYWDYIGWKDPFAKRWSTTRQRQYTDALGSRYLYTPEIIVNGRQDVVGSDRASVAQSIEGERKGLKIALTIKETGDENYLVDIPAANVKAPATVWFALYDRAHTTAVANGENGGRTLHDANVVREWRALGRYDGSEAKFPVKMSMTDQNGCAILLQADHRPGDGQGPILGAAVVEGR